MRKDKFESVPHDDGQFFDDETRRAYDALADEYALLRELLRARQESGLTQEEVAQRMGTKRPAVSRIEAASPKHSPSVATLRRYAQALGKRLEIRIV